MAAKSITQIMSKEELKEQMKQDATKKTALAKKSATTKKKAVATTPKQNALISMKTPKQVEAESKKQLDSIDKTIRKEINSMETSYINIAYALYQIRENKLYKVNKYKNVYEMASKEYGLSRGTCNDYISIIERFAVRIDGKATPKLGDKYENYKISSLMVMCGIKDDKTLNEVKPDMTVKEIKNLKKKSSGKQSKQETIDVDYTETRTTLICEIKTYEEIADSEAIIRKLLESGHRVQIVEAWEEYHSSKDGE